MTFGETLFLQQQETTPTDRASHSYFIIVLERNDVLQLIDSEKAVLLNMVFKQLTALRSFWRNGNKSTKWKMFSFENPKLKSKKPASEGKHNMASFGS
jgi:hypothetical protein